MGTLTFSQLDTEIRAAVGNRVDANFTDLRVQNALNLAQQRLSRYYDFPELNQPLTTQGIVTGQLAVDKWLPLPATTKVVHSLVLQDGANSRKLIEKPWRMFDEKIPLPEYLAPGWPEYYERFSLSSVMLFPVPQSAFTYFLRATLLPTAFSGATGQVSDYTDKDDILIYLTAEYFTRLNGRPDLADAFEQMGMRRMAEAKSNVEDRPDMNASNDDMGGGLNEAQYWANAFVKNAP